jgi:phosphonate transport system substrate-binding protein
MVDIGAMSNIDFEQIPEDIRSKLKIIDRTVEVPRHIVSHRSGLDPVLVESIKRILMEMDQDPEGVEIMNNFSHTTRYEEISSDNEVFRTIKDMLRLIT